MTPTEKKKTRLSIPAYCAAARSNEPQWHYSQARPFRFVDRPEVGWHTADCSSFVINCFWNASHDLKLYIPDPSGSKYWGFGNTWVMEAWLRSHGKRVTTQGFLPGDIAMYNGHTTICHKAGDSDTSKWTSHGWEGGPEVRQLHYRNDLVGVWRHPSLL